MVETTGERQVEPAHISARSVSFEYERRSASTGLAALYANALRRILVHQCKPGMIVGQDIYNDQANLLLSKGSRLSERRIKSLAGMGYFTVIIDDPEAQGVHLPEVVSLAVKAQAARKLRQTFDTFTDISADFADRDMDAIEEALQSDAFRKQAAEIDPFAGLMMEVHGLVEDIVNAETLDGMSSLMVHDDYTFQHSVDVAIISAMIGKRLELEEERLRQLVLGAMLHDVGKVFVSLDILCKPGRLTHAEFEQIKVHPVLGWRMLRVSAEATENLIAHHVCYQHHERQDGSGYPRGLRGSNRIAPPNAAQHDPHQMHIVGEIGAVADVYEALIADRPFRRAHPPESVRSILNERSGSHFNSEILAKALEIIPTFPTGAEIEVVTGPFRSRAGIVVHVDMEHLQRPIIRLLRDENGKRIDPVEVDLLETDYEIRSVGAGREMEVTAT